MQFIANGPDIPDALLQAHEEGRVVFFCGAGISYPAGLPGFEGLVNEIYRLVGTTRTKIEQDAYCRSQFDATLDLLERRLPGQRIAVRNVLATALEPKLRRKGATDTHVALLQLARNREGALRLVTTNFDRIFELVVKRTRQPITTYAAPMLPIPKNSRWNGLVYLHGLLPAKEDESELNRLVLTSGDFGLAYLTERWAARFVSELFRNYVVCFIGYSINDPVLRYMMDALAADRMLGEINPQAYALGDYKPGQEDSKKVEWEAKGVAPILYQVPSGGNDHTALHGTLKAWAETYRDGILGKERIVVDNALAHPSASTKQDDFVCRMLWALSDASGLPAKRFADFNPVPTLEWLEPLSQSRYQHGDLPRIGVQPSAEVDEKLRFSLLLRPAPYTRAPWMSLVSGGTSNSEWDEVMSHLARWLVRHLNDPALIIWLAQWGGQLHRRLLGLIEERLDQLVKLESEGNATALEELRINAPNAIPRPQMQKLWRLLLTGRVKSPRRDLNLYPWRNRLKRDGLTATLRLELRELLAPKVAFKKPFRSSGSNADGPVHLKQLVDWELVLTAGHVHSALGRLSDESWSKALPALLDDFQKLLRDALDLLSELGEANEHSDRSVWDLPSVTPHRQNRGYREWVALIELLRDAWLATRDLDPERATRVAQSWFDLPYPTFKRLALFAASYDGSIPPDQWVDWLTLNHGRWLWSTDTKRETMRLLVLQGANLSPQTRGILEEAVLAGPPRAMYPDDLEPERWQSLVDHLIWVRLAKLREGCGELGDASLRRLKNLTAENPDLRSAGNDRDEFSFWISGPGEPGYEERRTIVLAPRNRQGLVEWLKQSPPSLRPSYEDTWREVCRTRFFHSLYALCDLAEEGCWPTARWREALQAWSEEDKVLRSWRFAAPLVQSMSDEVLQKTAHDVAWWLEAASKSIERHEAAFLGLCSRILSLAHQDSTGTIDDSVDEAINRPVGLVTQALLNLWFTREPNDNDALPNDIGPLFTQLCDIRVEQFRYGRVLLASRLIALFRVDRPWTEVNLLPLFDWASNPAEAKAVWQGFLWSPRLHWPLLITLKEHFLETIRRYKELGEYGRQLAAFLTYAALEPIEGYAAGDFQVAFSLLPQEGLQEAAHALLEALEAAGEKREDYWRNRIQPFWRQVWPKLRNLASDSMAESLALLSIAARNQFPAALSTVLAWLRPIEFPYYVIHTLHDSGLAERYPADALILLDAILNNQPWVSDELRQCLDSISQASPRLIEDLRYRKLSEYSRRHRI